MCHSNYIQIYFALGVVCFIDDIDESVPEDICDICSEF